MKDFISTFNLLIRIPMLVVFFALVLPLVSAGAFTNEAGIVGAIILSFGSMLAGVLFVVIASFGFNALGVSREKRASMPFVTGGLSIVFMTFVFIGGAAVLPALYTLGGALVLPGFVTISGFFGALLTSVLFNWIMYATLPRAAKPTNGT